MFHHLLCLLVFGLRSVGPSKVNLKDSRPNILLLLTDDQDVELVNNYDVINFRYFS